MNKKTNHAIAVIPDLLCKENGVTKAAVNVLLQTIGDTYISMYA